MRQTYVSFLRKFLAVAGMFAALVGSVQAVPTLTAAAITDGFSLSLFADGFPVSSCCGPLGIAFAGGGKVMVSDGPGNVRIFATDTDGQSAGAAPVAANFGGFNAIGLARVGNFVYMTLQTTGAVSRLNLDGTFNSGVVSGIPTATGIYANPVTGKLYVSDCCSNTGIWVVDPVTNTSSKFKASGSYDGLSISADGLTIYAELGQHIIGYRLSDGVQVFDSGFISGADGTELGAGTLAGQIFVNTNNGELWEVSLASSIQKRLVFGGTRGDFVTADPNGSLLFTQTSDIRRLTAPAGGCIGVACNQVPEPSSLALIALGLLGLAHSTTTIRRRSAAR